MCKGFALGKHAKTTFPISKQRLIGILDLVHSEVCEACPLLVDK